MGDQPKNAHTGLPRAGKCRPHRRTGNPGEKLGFLSKWCDFPSCVSLTADKSHLRPGPWPDSEKPPLPVVSESLLLHPIGTCGLEMAGAFGERLLNKSNTWPFYKCRPSGSDWMGPAKAPGPGRCKINSPTWFVFQVLCQL